MSSIDSAHYTFLKDEFRKVCKRVLKENLSSNPAKHREYLTDLANTFNAIITYVADFYDSFDTHTKNSFREEWIYFRDKTLLVYGKLNVSIATPREFFTPLSLDEILHSYEENNKLRAESIPPSSLVLPTQIISESATASTSTLTNSTVGSVSQNPKGESFQKKSVPKATQTNKFQKTRGEQPPDSDLFLNFENLFNSNMALTPVEFIRIAAQTINRNYDGNPLGLDAFVNSVDLLKEVSNADVNAIFLRFVKSKLEGKALESIPAEPASVDEIITALRRQIQPDNSKVVAGRLLALRPDRSKLVEFTEQAEKLADALQRSLIIEGISQAKAREMSIEKTVEVCRGAARSDLVKSVLASTKFESPKEVIAKYIVESSTEEREKQILAFRTYQKQNKRGNRGNNSSTRGRSNGNNDNNYRNRNGRSSNRNNNYNNNNNRNYNNRGNNYNNGGNNGQSNGGQYNNRGRNNYNNNGGNRNNNDNRNVRYSENCDAPQLQLGEIQNRN